jgi:hypothetical protein
MKLNASSKLTLLLFWTFFEELKQIRSLCEKGPLGGFPSSTIMKRKAGTTGCHKCLHIYLGGHGHL